MTAKQMVEASRARGVDDAYKIALQVSLDQMGVADLGIDAPVHLLAEVLRQKQAADTGKSIDELLHTTLADSSAQATLVSDAQEAGHLLPCPWPCGTIGWSFARDSVGRYYVWHECGCRGPSATSEEKARAAWNRRMKP